MLKKTMLGFLALLLVSGVCQATIMLDQGYCVGCLNAGKVDGIGVATGGSVINIENAQTSANLDGCNIEVGLQKQNGILVQGGTAIGAGSESNAGFVQGAGAASNQYLLASNESSDPIVTSQGTVLSMGQAVYADDCGAANAGQGALLANGQVAGTNNGAAGNASVIGAVNTSSAVAGPCSEAMSGNALNMTSYQMALVN